MPTPYDFAEKPYLSQAQAPGGLPLNLDLLQRYWRDPTPGLLYFLLRETAKQGSIPTRASFESHTLRRIIQRELDGVHGLFAWTRARKGLTLKTRYVLSHEQPEDIEALVKEFVPPVEISSGDKKLVYNVVKKLEKNPLKYALTAINLLEYAGDHQQADAFGVKALETLIAQFETADREQRKSITLTLLPLAQRYQQRDLEVSIYLRQSDYETAVDLAQEYFDGDELRSFYQIAYDKVNADKKTPRRFELLTELALVIDDTHLLLRTRRNHLEWLLRQNDVEVPLDIAQAVGTTSQLLQAYKRNIQLYSNSRINEGKDIVGPDYGKVIAFAEQAYAQFTLPEFAHAVMSAHESVGNYSEALKWARLCDDRTIMSRLEQRWEKERVLPAYQQ